MKPTPYIAAKDSARDAIVTFGAGYGFLHEPFEWRVSEYLQNEFLYAIGGLDSNGRPSSTVECYDASTNVLMAIASLTTARHYHGVIVLGGFIFAIGGFATTLSSAERYDPSTNVWTVIGSITTARWGHGVMILGGFIYAIGGADDTGTTLSSAERYDPSTNVWTAVASMTTGRSNFGAVTF